MDDVKEDAVERGETDEKKDKFRAKVKSVSRMLRMYKILRQERETVMQLKSFSPGKKIPQGLLSQVF